MAMGVMGQLGASITGNIETAKLLIYDYRGVTQRTRLEGPLLPGAAPQSITTKLSLENMAKFRQAATLAESKGNIFLDGSSTKTFTVHFNPSNLKINASNVSSNKPDAQGKENVVDSNTKATLTLTTTLYFDEMNVYDSFMVDKFTMGASASGVTNIVSTIAKNVKGKTWSVRDEVEGLIAALRNPYTRNVSFRWADFSFTGQLSVVNATYTMFNTTGEPVRASVLLRINHEMDKVFLQKWYTEYDNATMGNGSSLTKIGQSMGNIVNLNL